MRHLGIQTLWVVVTCLTALRSQPASADEMTLPRVRSVAFSPDGKLLAAAAGEPKKAGGVTVWEFAAGKVWFHHEAKDGASAAAFSPDGQLLAVAEWGGAVRLFDIGAKEERGVLKHDQAVRAVAFNADGELVVTAGDDKTVRFWNHAEQKVMRTLSGPTKGIRCVALGPDGRVVAGADDSGHVWDGKGDRPRGPISHDGQGLPAVLFAPDGRSCVSGGYDGRVIVWHAKEILPRLTLRNFGGVSGMAYCPKTEMLAVCSWRSISLRKLPFREATAAERKRIDALLAQLDEDAIEKREAAADELFKIGLPAEPSLKQAAKESKSAEVRLRARKTREKILNHNDVRLTCDEAEVDAAAFTPDGKHVAGAARDGHVYLWETATGKALRRLTPAK